MKIANLFGKRVKDNQNKSIKLNYAFTDLKGRKYYSFSDTAQEINPARFFEFFLPLVNEYQAKIKNEEIELYIETAKKLKTYEQLMLEVRMLEERMKITRDVLIVYELMAVVYLREDEENVPIHEDYVKEKARDIRDVIIANGGGGNGFFQCTLLREFLESARISQGSLTGLDKLSTQSRELFRTALSLLVESVQSSNLSSSKEI